MIHSCQGSQVCGFPGVEFGWLLWHIVIKSSGIPRSIGKWRPRYLGSADSFIELRYEYPSCTSWHVFMEIRRHWFHGLVEGLAFSRPGNLGNWLAGNPGAREGMVSLALPVPWFLPALGLPTHMEPRSPGDQETPVSWQLDVMPDGNLDKSISWVAWKQHLLLRHGDK